MIEAVPPPSLIALAAAVLHLPDRPERILEIGCGSGDGVFFLAREFPGARVRGVDPSAEAIRKAVSRVGLDPEGRVAFKRGRLRKLPYPDDFFDLVAQAGGSLRPGEIARVLRPGGHLILVGEWRWRDWRLGGQGFDPVEADEVDGERFHILRLQAGSERPE
ncbi:MAG TPA: class I SAM-dependent methyltransferase [Solirubrobacterales bacterium]|nr:class I SAM-dependent methyltransferase [Solirubrobacterales bacterium]